MKLFTKVECVHDINNVVSYQVWEKKEGFFEKWRLFDDGIKTIEEAETGARCPGLTDKQQVCMTVVYMGAFENGVPAAQGSILAEGEKSPKVKVKKYTARTPVIQDEFLEDAPNMSFRKL